MTQMHFSAIYKGGKYGWTLDTGIVDMMMFSINPAYDYQKGDYAIGEVAERAELYRECEHMGVGISDR